MFKSTVKGIAGEMFKHPKAGRMYDGTDGPIHPEAQKDILEKIDMHQSFFLDTTTGYGNGKVLGGSPYGNGNAIEIGYRW